MKIKIIMRLLICLVFNLWTIQAEVFSLDFKVSIRDYGRKEMERL